MDYHTLAEAGAGPGLLRGYTQSEIAAALGLPLGTGKTRIRLAMDRLHTILHDQS